MAAMHYRPNLFHASICFMVQHAVEKVGRPSFLFSNENACVGINVTNANVRVTAPNIVSGKEKGER